MKTSGDRQINPRTTPSLKEKILSPAYSRAIILAAVFFFGLGLVWHLIPFTSNLVRPLTPYMLLVFGVLVMAPFIAADGFILLIWAVASYAAAFALEAAGVATGAIFGPYEYSSVLGTNILRVPPIIGFNWIVVVSGCATLATFLVYIGMPKVDGGRSMRVIRILVIALVSGILAAAFDWVMEPAAVALDYWTWLVPTIPFQNYFTWFAFTAVSTGVWASMTRNHVFRTRYMFSKPWKTRNRRETWGLFIFPYHCWSSLAWRVLASWSGGKPASQ